MLKRPSLDDYLAEVVRFVRELRVGLLKPHELSAERMVFGLDECITCAGMDPIGQRICHFEVGFVAGCVEAFIDKRVRATESKCNANGEGICEVTLNLAPEF